MGIKYVQLLFVGVGHLHVVLALSSHHNSFLLVVFRFQCGYVVNDTNSAHSVDLCGYAFLPNAEIILLKLVKILELSLKLPRHEQMLRFLMHSIHVVVVLELLQFNLVQAKSWDTAQGCVCSKQSSLCSGKETLLTGLLRARQLRCR